LASKSYLINLSDRNLTEGKFKDLQQNGVGRDTVLKFLGGQGNLSAESDKITCGGVGKILISGTM